MTIMDHLKRSDRTVNGLRKPLVCKDGLKLSIQASSSHYCNPRIDDAEEYTRLEVMNMSKAKLRTLRIYDCGGVYGNVPLRVLENLVRRHGGIL